MRNVAERNVLGFRPYTNVKLLGTTTAENIRIANIFDEGGTLRADIDDGSGNWTFQNNIIINGDLSILGSTTSVETNNLVIDDVSIKISSGNTANLTDGCFYTTYNDGTQKYSGLFNDASDSNKWKLFDGLTEEPTSTVNTGHGKIWILAR
jgi:hypothetical protein